MEKISVHSDLKSEQVFSPLSLVLSISTMGSIPALAYIYLFIYFIYLFF